MLFNRIKHIWIQELTKTNLRKAIFTVFKNESLKMFKKSFFKIYVDLNSKNTTIKIQTFILLVIVIV